MAPDAVVALLEQALHFSRQMLVAAERDAWPEFLELDQQRNGILLALQQNTWPDALWQDAERASVASRVESFMAINDELTRRATAWHGELRSLLGEARLSSRISDAYAGSSGA